MESARHGEAVWLRQGPGASLRNENGTANFVIIVLSKCYVITNTRDDYIHGNRTKTTMFTTKMDALLNQGQFLLPH